MHDTKDIELMNLICPADKTRAAPRNNYLLPVSANEKEIDGVEYDPDTHRYGILYFRIGTFKAGCNSEQIRKLFQNRCAHDITRGGKMFRCIRNPINEVLGI